MGFRVVQNFLFGGVDSRSNPLNMPNNRSIRCRNWEPNLGGWLQLRSGYSTVTMSTTSNSLIHSQFDYKLWDGTRYILFIQGTALKRIALASGTVTQIATLSASTRASFFRTTNRIVIGNGSEMKMYDGTTLRDVGVRAPTDAEALNVTVEQGVRIASAGTAAGNAAGGTFAATTKSGFQFYVHYFDTTLNERGPARATATARITTTGATSSVDLSALENLSAVNANWVKIFSRTGDGTAYSNFCTNTSTSSTSNSRSSTTLTVSSVAHGLSVGNVVILSGTTNFDGMYAVATVPGVDSFTVTLSTAAGANTSAGTVKRCVSVANATTTGSITSPDTDTTITGNADRGVNDDTVGGVQPGYKYYMCYYNPTTGEQGNRIAIGPRFVPTAKCNVKIAALPDLSGVNTELVKLIGRTGDGAEVPYAIADAANNLIYAANAVTTITLTDPGVDFDNELPTRNGVPNNMDKMAKVGDRILGNTPNSPYIYRSATELEARTGTFAGQPYASWSPLNFETFPTAEPVTCVADYEQEGWIFTKNDGAILSDLGGVLTWIGPFNVGCAGQRAFTKTPYGPFWLTGEKHLATIGKSGPLIVSGEYEAGLLSQIGDSYLTNSEVTYFRDATTGKDQLKIKGQNSSGTPFVVVHDFAIRDERNPQGQGYEVTYSGDLASDFTLVQTRDTDDKLRIFAGSSTGQLYQLDSGGVDAASTYTADYISLLNFGPDRPRMHSLEYHGDSQVKLSVVHDLDEADTAFVDMAADTYPSRPDDNYYRAQIVNGTEMVCAFIRIRLVSHASDGSLTLSTPIHMPLESYGRVYDLAGVVQEERKH